MTAFTFLDLCKSLSPKQRTSLFYGNLSKLVVCGVCVSPCLHTPTSENIQVQIILQSTHQYMTEDCILLWQELKFSKGAHFA
jgi:hypothetical protein